MKTKILKVQKSNFPIWETKLSVNGPISDSTPFYEQSYEMRIDLYYTEDKYLQDRTIIVDSKHYESNISKYGMDALLKGVELTSLFDATAEPGGLDIDHYRKEVESIAYSIIAKMEQDTFFNHYNPVKLKDYIEDKLLSLKNKFKIEPK